MPPIPTYSATGSLVIFVDCKPVTLRSLIRFHDAPQVGPMALIGNSALVAGGSRGIGRAAAIALARRGADVAILYRSADGAAASVCKEIAAIGRRAYSIRADVSDPEMVSSAFATIKAEFGVPTMIVNSTGAAAPEEYVHEQSPEDFRRFIAADLCGAYNVIHHAVRTLREAGGGSIIAVSSIATQMLPSRNSAGSASKAATEALIKVVAREEARHAIRANVVAVGITDTDMVRPMFEKWGAAVTQKVLSGIPLGRIGRPEEVADLIESLLDERAAYVTGKTFQIDGGQFIGG